MSQKEETKPPKFDTSHADERKMRELYGNSQYRPQGKEWSQQKPQTATPADRKSRKAANL